MGADLASLRLGVIGCGRATQQLHLPALRHVREVRVVALADTDAARLAAVGDEFGIARRHRDAAALIHDETVDAVAVCVPVGGHAEPALAAIAAQKHVFVEKPLAVTLEDGERLVAAAQQTQKVTALGFNLRCHRLVMRARDAIRGGAVGQVHQIVTVWGSTMQHEPGFPGWRRHRASGGGALFEIGIHHLDLCAFLLDEPIAEVQLLSRSQACEDESASLLGRTRSGVLITSAFSQVAPPMNTIMVIGDAGRISFSLYQADSYTGVRRSDPQYGLGRRLQHIRRWREFPENLRVARGGGDYLLSYGTEWRRFAEAVRGGRPPPASFADGLAALQVVHAATLSASERRAVALQVA